MATQIDVNTAPPTAARDDAESGDVAAERAAAAAKPLPLRRRLLNRLRALPLSPKEQADLLYENVHRDVYLPIIAFIVVALASVVVVPVFMVFKASGEAAAGDGSKLAYCAVQATYSASVCSKLLAELPGGDRSIVDSAGLVYFATAVTAIDPTSSTMKIAYDGTLAGTMDNKGMGSQFALQFQPGNTLGKAIIIAGGTNPAGGGGYTDRQSLARFEITVAMTPEVPLTNYPFDTYNIELVTQGSYYTTPAATDPNPLQLIMRSGGSLPGWTVTYAAADYNQLISYDDQLTYITQNIRIERSPATKFFAVFVVIIMWFLSSFMFMTTLDMIYLRKREVQPPHCAIAAALLFALPNVRNVQPNVPQIGTSLDALGFFWNMMLVSVSLIMMLAAFVGNYAKKK